MKSTYFCQLDFGFFSMVRGLKFGCRVSANLVNYLGSTGVTQQQNIKAIRKTLSFELKGAMSHTRSCTCPYLLQGSLEENLQEKTWHTDYKTLEKIYSCIKMFEQRFLSNALQRVVHQLHNMKLQNPIICLVIYTLLSTIYTALHGIQHHINLFSLVRDG